MNDESLNLEISKKRRAFAQARAIIQRSRNAGIPEKYMRLKISDIEPLICNHYHGSTDSVIDSIYRRPIELFKKPFIVIDGGDNYKRKKMGFAILFRMISCDRYGKFYDCRNLCGEFQTIRSESFYRNDLVSDIKNKDVIFINEFSPRNFSAHFESGLFFDQLLEYRDDYNKPTIITFSSPLESSSFNIGNSINDDRCGIHLAALSQSDLDNKGNVFRIKVK